MSASDSPPLRVGLIGFGLAGGTFHAPLIAATPGLALSAVVTTDLSAGVACPAGAPQYAARRKR